MKIKKKRMKSLRRKSSHGFRGYPVATVALYGPNDSLATKVAVGIIPSEGADAVALERWLSENRDIRSDPGVEREIARFIANHEAKTVVMSDRIIGCPHEEGVDYPKGEVCPECPFWAGRDRWTGEYEH